MTETHTTTIIVTQNVGEYRATVPVYINKRDVVLEIGCGAGKTTRILAKHCKEVVGIDKGGSLLKAKEKYPWLQFEQIDGFDIPGIRELGKDFNKIYIDISGNRDVGTVIPLIQKHEAVFKPELIVIKNSKLKRILQKYIVWEDLTT